MEFNDVKRKDYIELAGIAEHHQGTEIARHRVKWRLREALENAGVSHPYDQIFYSAAQDGTVIFSKSLVQMLTEAVLNNERHSIQVGTGGDFYAAQYTMSEEARVDISVETANDVMALVYEHIKETEAKG
ncbi:MULTISPECIES: hypothetical protein [unclassified Pseudomonas]|uniref:hypothetical protein n=1 Tax=unclassified Pseudomonas TaxID=196821 RepID=UPI000487EF2F|nr:MULTISPECIES: hypothetical protein [unclassified Pseudomonas]RAS23735.1 hypothetical protein H040_04030 [Pseudomonas sp. URMO17WK12:I7]SMF45235.1 hypothetical protein SAMN02745903_03640 [Pseudomonas sp. URMO17WK12:I5]